jgi:hypothetical protein
VEEDPEKVEAALLDVTSDCGRFAHRKVARNVTVTVGTVRAIVRNLHRFGDFGLEEMEGAGRLIYVWAGKRGNWE